MSAPHNTARTRPATRGRSLALAAAAAAASPSLPTLAQGLFDLPKPPQPSRKWEELPPIFVSATQIPASPNNLPHSVSSITLETLERQVPRTTPDALRDLPSVMIQKTAHGQGSPFLRGFTGFRTLFLIDGIRLNNSTFRDGPNPYWNTVDSLSLERLEVVRGPSAVLYGSDAIGGTVNAFTRSHREFGPGIDWNSGVSYRFASAERSHIGRAETGANLGPTVGLNAGLSFKDFGDLQAGDNTRRQPRTGYAEWDLDAKVQWLIHPNQQLVFAHQTVDLDNAWRTHGTVHAQPWRGTVAGSDLARIHDHLRHLDYLQYHAVDLDGFIQEVHAHVSFHIQDEDEDRTRGDGRREVQGTYVDTLGVSLQLQTPTAFGRWVYGTEYYHDWVDSHYRRYNAAGSLQQVRRQGPVGDDATYDLAGLYAQNTIPLLDDRLQLTVGGRYNHAAADIDRAETPGTGQPLAISDRWNSLVGSARALASLDPEAQWRLFGGVSQGFRAPNLSDLSRFDIAGAGELEVPADNLNPEEFLTVEAGIRTRFGPVRAEATLYRTWIDDLVVRVPTGTTASTGEAIVAKQNSGNGHIHGAEATLAADLSEALTAWGSFSWMEGLLETPVTAGGPSIDEPVSRLMPRTFQAGLRWQSTDRRLWAEFAATFAAAQQRLSAADRRDNQRIPPGGTPAYEVFHLRGGWRPSERTSLTLAVENLADTDYRIHGSGLNEPGRNFIVALDLRF